MRPFRALALILVCAACASRGQASGINLTWDACSVDGGLQNKTFSCNANAGSWVMYGSFVLAADQPNVGVEITVDFHAQIVSLPSSQNLRTRPRAGADPQLAR